MVSYKNYHLIDNEDFLIFQISKLVTCFIDENENPNQLLIY